MTTDYVTTVIVTRLQLVYPMLDYGGARARGSDLFGDDDPVAVTKRFFKVSYDHTENESNRELLL